jgi:hypothetical protein
MVEDRGWVDRYNLTILHSHVGSVLLEMGCLHEEPGNYGFLDILEV